MIHINDVGFNYLIANHELGRDQGDEMKLAILPTTEIKVWLLFGEKRSQFSYYCEMSGKETHPLIQFSQIPRDMIESRRKEIDRIKEELRNIPPR